MWGKNKDCTLAALKAQPCKRPGHTLVLNTQLLFSVEEYEKMIYGVSYHLQLKKIIKPPSKP